MFILLMLCCLIGCTTPELHDYPPYDPLKQIKVQIDGVENATAEDKKHLYEAIVVLENTVNSEAFYHEVMQFKFTTTELTNLEVYNRIMSGEEKTIPEPNSILEMEVLFFYREGLLGGTASPTRNRITLNTNVFGVYGAAMDAQIILHEWTHLSGFSHTGSGDLTSVPYAVGRMITKLN